MDNPFEPISAKLDLLFDKVNAIGEKLLIIEKQDVSEQEVGGIELAMRMTGLSRSAIYAHTCKGTIPFHKPPGSKKLIFYSLQLKNWIEKKQNEN
jgi:predicted DNA-binding transcriptional regulator AlpA